MLNTELIFNCLLTSLTLLLGSFDGRKGSLPVKCLNFSSRTSRTRAGRKRAVLCGRRHYALCLSIYLYVCVCVCFCIFSSACCQLLVVLFLLPTILPSVLWHCQLGVRKGTWPVKIECWGAGMVICLEQGADCLHMVQLMPLPSQNSINPKFIFRW